MKPTIGRIVHFYERPDAKPRAAIVVDLDVIGNPSLRVFAARGTNDTYYYGVPQRGETTGWFWDWPPREPGEVREVAQAVLDTPMSDLVDERADEVFGK